MTIVATVSQNTNLNAKVAGQDKILVTNYQINATNLKIGDLFNVNASNATDGSVLVYNGNNLNWEATPNLDNANTIINGGNF